MWPFEPSRQETLRIGRFAAERWRGAPGRLEHVASHALPPTPPGSARGGRGSAFGEALGALYADKPATSITVLLESACMPVMAVEAGASLWRPEQMLALARHRFAALHGEPGAVAADCDVRLDYRAGDPTALAFCLPPSLRAALLEAGVAAGLRVRRVLPAFAWGLASIGPVARHQGWLAWQEQDRMLLAQVRKARVSSLDAAAAPAIESTALLQRVASACVRRGVLQVDAPILATRWRSDAGDPPAHAVDPRVTWLEIAPGPPATTSVPANRVVTPS